MTAHSAPASTPPDPAREPTLVYLAGVSYCGSTLLSFVLNTHPRILSVGEMALAPRFERPGFPCSCGHTLASCDFFARVRQELEDSGVAFDTGKMGLYLRYSDRSFWNRLALYSLPDPWCRLRDTLRDHTPRFRARAEALRERNLAFVSTALRVAGKDVFLDATKNPNRIPFLSQASERFRVIHLVRDPRGYYYSARRHNQLSAAEAARQWVIGHRETEQYVRRLRPDQSMRVRYEWLCSEPNERFSELSQFMGAGPFDVPDDYRAWPHHILGNAMRKAGDGRSAIRLDEKWRRTLDSDELATVAKVAGPLARRYGYDI